MTNAKLIVQHRLPPSKDGILSTLHFDGKVRYALERPWIPSAPGGRPNFSCVPAGVYRLRKHTRPNGDVVLALVNPGLAVYYLATDRPNGVGRFLILLHSASYVDQLEGCIAPGMNHTITARGLTVTDSREAMQELMDYVGDDEAELEIIGSNTYEVAA